MPLLNEDLQNSPIKRTGIEPTPTRERILVEAATLFSRQGYIGTSTREIAEAVGIAQPGLYRHFKSKEDIILALGDAILDPLIEIINTKEKQKVSCATQLVHFVWRICHQLIESPYSAQFWISWPYEAAQFKPAEKKYLKLSRYLGSLIRSGMKNEEFRAVPVEIARETILNLIIAGIFQDVGDVNDRINHTIEVCLRSLIANPSSLDRVLSESFSSATKKKNLVK